MPALNALVQEYHKKVTFTLVYILEAHASDEWPIGNAVSVAQHTSLKQRLHAARALQHTLQPHTAIRILVDTIEDTFNKTYSSWPTRAWIIKHGVVRHKSDPGNGNGSKINIEDLEDCIKNCI